MQSQNKLITVKLHYSKYDNNNELSFDKILMLDNNGKTILDGYKSKNNENSNSIRKNHKNSLINISINIFSTLEMFKAALPLLMETNYIVSTGIFKREIVQYLKEKSENTETILMGAEEAEVLYRIGENHISSVRTKFRKFTNYSNSLKELPKLYAIGIVNAYDDFFTNLIRVILTKKPDIFHSSEKKFSFSEINEMGSLNDFKEKIINDEIDQIMRGSHSDQIKWIKKKLEINNLGNNNYWRVLVELFERRNIFIHSNGIVSKQYMNVCTENKLDVSRVIIGQELTVDPEYFKKAVESMIGFCVVLIQIIWNRLFPNEAIQAVETMIYLTKQLVDSGSASLAKDILLKRLDLPTSKQSLNDNMRKNIVIEAARSSKISGDNPETYMSILSKEDWSSASNFYKLYENAIAGNAKDAKKYFEKLIKAGDIDKSKIGRDTVFKDLLKDEEFRLTYEKIESDDGNKETVPEKTPIRQSKKKERENQKIIN